jgi:hypothetical protein
MIHKTLAGQKFMLVISALEQETPPEEISTTSGYYQPRPRTRLIFDFVLCGFRDHGRHNLASWNYGSHGRRALLSVHPASRLQTLPAMPIWRIGDSVLVTGWLRSASESDSR